MPTSDFAILFSKIVTACGILGPLVIVSVLHMPEFFKEVPSSLFEIPNHTTYFMQYSLMPWHSIGFKFRDEEITPIPKLSFAQLCSKWFAVIVLKNLHLFCLHPPI